MGNSISYLAYYINLDGLYKLIEKYRLEIFIMYNYF
jgi:hypothetical protein